MATIKELREDRRKVNAEIEVLRAKATTLSDLIREAEGPIPDRSFKNIYTGYRIVKP